MSDLLIAGIVLVAAAFGGYLFRDHAEKLRQHKERERVKDTKDEALKDAETQDDTTLIDRLTRKP